MKRELNIICFQTAKQLVQPLHPKAKEARIETVSTVDKEYFIDTFFANDGINVSHDGVLIHCFDCPDYSFYTEGIDTTTIV